MRGEYLHYLPMGFRFFIMRQSDGVVVQAEKWATEARGVSSNTPIGEEEW